MSRREGDAFTLVELLVGLGVMVVLLGLLLPVLVNLIRNGIESMQDGHDPNRRITVTAANGDGKMVQVAVADAGSGIPSEQLPKMFDAFFTTKQHGMGMGLSISRSIVEAHGGRLWATANAGRGLTIRFTLPTPEPSTS